MLAACGHPASLRAPGTASPPAAARDDLRIRLAEELRRLRAAESLPAADLLRYLSDFGSRLAALAILLGGHPELEALARDLTAGGPDADALWHRAVRDLESLSEPKRRRPFWKC